MSQSPVTGQEVYRYAATGRRAVKTHTQQRGAACAARQQVRYLPGLEVRLGRTGSPRETVRRVAEAGSVRINCKGAGRQVRYSLSDRSGSAVTELDGAGACVSRETFYPFGGTAAREGKPAYKTKGYAGKERDVTGLLHYGFRSYAPWLMRWLNPDPAGTADGLNLFRLCRNNPVTLGDPDGLAPGDEELPPLKRFMRRWEAETRPAPQPAIIVPAPPAPHTVESAAAGSAQRHEERLDLTLADRARAQAEQQNRPVTPASPGTSQHFAASLTRQSLPYVPPHLLKTSPPVNIVSPHIIAPTTAPPELPEETLFRPGTSDEAPANYLRPTVEHTGKHLTQENIDSLIQQARGSNAIACFLCLHKYCYSLGSFKSHLLHQHTQRETFKCTECNFSTTYYINFTRHQSRHQLSGLNKCNICSYHALTTIGLKRHERQNH
jgi:RHS repeat-associated protein